MSEANAAANLGHGAWPTSFSDGMKPEAAADKALKRIGAILAKYPIAQA